MTLDVKRQVLTPVSSKKEGFQEGSGVCQTVKRLENEAQKNSALKIKMDVLHQKISSVVC
jgi:hypothetical protein